jgi:hypothetical protein
LPSSDRNSCRRKRRREHHRRRHGRRIFEHKSRQFEIARPQPRPVGRLGFAFGGKYDVEAHRLGPAMGDERICDGGDRMSRPRPVAEIADASRIDIDVDYLDRRLQFTALLKTPVDRAVLEKIQEPEVAQHAPQNRDRQQHHPTHPRKLGFLFGGSHDRRR